MIGKLIFRQMNSLFKSKVFSSLSSSSSLRIFASTVKAPPRAPINSQGLGITDIADIPRSINYRQDFDQNLTDQQKKERKRFNIYRFNPNNPEDVPKFVSYYINLKECGPMFLDALIKIKDEIDPTLSFRRSCREGICGSCAMNIDGRHHLACICPIPKNNVESHVSPLMFLFVLKDLVVDMTNFYTQYKSIDPYLKRKSVKEDETKQNYQSQADRQKIDGLYECVLCGSCQATCPSYWWHSQDYLGPAVLMQAYRWIIDSRDEYTDQRLEKIGGDMRLGECLQVGLCSLTCPKGLDPRAALEELKEMYASYEERRDKEVFSAM